MPKVDSLTTSETPHWSSCGSTDRVSPLHAEESMSCREKMLPRTIRQLQQMR